MPEIHDEVFDFTKEEPTRDFFKIVYDRHDRKVYFFHPIADLEKYRQRHNSKPVGHWSYSCKDADQVVMGKGAE